MAAVQVPGRHKLRLIPREAIAIETTHTSVFYAVPAVPKRQQGRFRRPAWSAAESMKQKSSKSKLQVRLGCNTKDSGTDPGVREEGRQALELVPCHHAPDRDLSIWTSFTDAQPVLLRGTVNTRQTRSRCFFRRGCDKQKIYPGLCKHLEAIKA